MSSASGPLTPDLDKAPRAPCGLALPRLPCSAPMQLNSYRPATDYRLNWPLMHERNPASQMESYYGTLYQQVMVALSESVMKMCVQRPLAEKSR